MGWRSWSWGLGLLEAIVIKVAKVGIGVVAAALLKVIKVIAKVIAIPSLFIPRTPKTRTARPGRRGQR